MVELFPVGAAASYNSDSEVGELLQEPGIVRRIASIPGAPGNLLTESGELNRKVLRKVSFENSEFRGRLERVLHPLVLERAASFAESLPESVQVLIWEVPLLYEVDFPIPRDMDLVVAASTETQLDRISTDRGLDRSLGKKIIESQLPIDEKVARGDVVIWNDGDMSALQAQIEHLVSRCNTLFTT